MKTYALLQDDVVLQIVSIEDDQDITTMFHPDVPLVLCDGTVKVGMIYTPGSGGAPGSFANPAPPALTKQQLLDYANAKQIRVAQGGFIVNANATGAALNVSVSTEPPYDGYLSSAVQLATLMAAGSIPTAAINWFQDSGSVALTPAQVTFMGVTVAGLIQSTFTTLAQVAAAIAAGTITTNAQVDTPPGSIPAWPVNEPPPAS